MARIERTYSQEKVKQMLKLNEVLLDYLLRELPSDAVLPSITDKGMNVLFPPPHSQIIAQSSICLPRTI